MYAVPFYSNSVRGTLYQSWKNQAERQECEEALDPAYQMSLSRVASRVKGHMHRNAESLMQYSTSRNTHVHQDDEHPCINQASDACTYIVVFRNGLNTVTILRMDILYY